MPKVSVIVPVYGVEKYIERCSRSLFEQTLDEIEYIFIDDCSPDRSIDILLKVIEDYPHRRDNIRIERMPQNSGLPTVRKFGFQIAEGDFIISCDSDDYVDANMYGQMYNIAIQGDYDLVQCDLDLVDDNGSVRVFGAHKKSLSSNELKKMIIEGRISNSLCNKLVKKELYKKSGLIFPTSGMDEDNTLSCQLAYYAKKLGYINIPYYKAYLNRYSMSRVVGQDKILGKYQGSFDNSKIIVTFLMSHGYNERSYAVIAAKNRPKAILLPHLLDRTFYKLWKHTYPEIDKLIIWGCNIPLKMRAKYILAHLGIYRFFR